MRALLLLFLVSQITSWAQKADFADVDFGKADSIANSYSGFPLYNLKALTDSLTRPLNTDIEKFRAIYIWVSTNIENDYSLYVKNQVKRKKLKNDAEKQRWNNKFGRIVFRTLLEKKTTVCTGYAYLIKEMANYADIKCEMVDGYGRTVSSNVGAPGRPNHTWNAVQINDKWYLCDATWSSGSIDMTQKIFIKNYSDVYFLLDPAMFVLDHFPIDQRWLLHNDSPTLDLFLEMPIVYNATLELGITRISPNSFNLYGVKNEPIKFSFYAPRPIDNLRLVIEYRDERSVVDPVLTTTPEGIFYFEHKFLKQGKYVVHVQSDNKVLYSYKATVD
ncbi:MAG: transglutaminase domain-containing protein [Cyclobacteriaceae bacterium]